MAARPPPPTLSRTPPPGPPPAPEESGPVAEELNEASFFLDQGMVDEAREILETVDLVRPGLPRTAALQERLQALEEARAQAGEDAAQDEPPPAERTSPPGIEPIPVRTGSYNLASELADELTELGPEETEAASEAPVEDLQYSVDEVFSEFKKGLEKVVHKGDVETHYDLGIAYKEMGLIDDALQMFDGARQGCQGQPKEIDCLLLIALLQGERGDWPAAVAASREALSNPHVGPREVSIRYELALAYESAGQPGKALAQYLAVERADPTHRDVADAVARLSSVRPEEEGVPARVNGSPAAKARKVGYL